MGILLLYFFPIIYSLFIYKKILADQINKSYADLLNEIDLLKKENNKKDRIIEKLQKTVEELASEVKQLNNELRKYINEHIQLPKFENVEHESKIYQCRDCGKIFNLLPMQKYLRIQLLKFFNYQ